jgi:hypothetical protein
MNESTNNCPVRVAQERDLATDPEREDADAYAERRIQTPIQLHLLGPREPVGDTIDSDVNEALADVRQLAAHALMLAASLERVGADTVFGKCDGEIYRTTQMIVDGTLSSAWSMAVRLHDAGVLLDEGARV